MQLTIAILIAALGAAAWCTVTGTGPGSAITNASEERAAVLDAFAANRDLP